MSVPPAANCLTCPSAHRTGMSVARSFTCGACIADRNPAQCRPLSAPGTMRFRLRPSAPAALCANRASASGLHRANMPVRVDDGDVICHDSHPVPLNSGSAQHPDLPHVVRWLKAPRWRPGLQDAELVAVGSARTCPAPGVLDVGPAGEQACTEAAVPADFRGQVRLAQVQVHPFFPCLTSPTCCSNASTPCRWF